MNFKGFVEEGHYDPEGREVKARAMENINELNKFDFSDCYFKLIEEMPYRHEDGSNRIGYRIVYSGQEKRRNV